MTSTPFLRALVGVLAATSFGSAQAADAATYPNRPVRLIVPYSPGGGADTLARTLQPGLVNSLGQTLVIDNRGGASAVIGTEMASRAVPDGYTILLITTTHTVTPTLMAKLPYDPVKDFSGISLAVSQPNVLVVHPSVPAKTAKELIAYAKTKKLAYASAGAGSQPHLGGELLKMVGGVDITHVPYKGSGPGVAAVLSNEVPMMLVGPLAIEGHLRAGRLRALAVADTKRSDVLPDIPTAAEAGIPGIESGTWYGFLAPAGTPKSTISALHSHVSKTMAVPTVKKQLLAQGARIIDGGPRVLEKTIRDEIVRWRNALERAGVRPNR